MLRSYYSIIIIVLFFFYRSVNAKICRTDTQRHGKRGQRCPDGMYRGQPTGI